KLVAATPGLVTALPGTGTPAGDLRSETPQSSPACSTRPSTRLRRSCRSTQRQRLKKSRQVLREQNVLVEDDLPARDLPAVIFPAHGVQPFADEEALLVLEAVLVDQELADRLHFGHTDAQQLDVRNHVRDARERLLAPL